jgi:radical SAM/Cys-rich protein
MLVSLKRRGSALSSGKEQLSLLNSGSDALAALPRFARRIGSPLQPAGLEIFQMNLGKLCNQTCKHCHVDAGPDRTEVMSRTVMERCLDILRAHQVSVIDLTGGAPELNPNFRWLVREISEIGCKTAGFRLIDRCNLTIIVSNSDFRSLPQFFAEYHVNIVSSLPYFTKSLTDRQRGNGVFERSIEALSLLNAVGYGKIGTGLLLDLVYNPSGAFLPGKQTELEADFRSALLRDHGIEFNRLFALANLPISRFLEYLAESGNLDDYMRRLVQAYNPTALSGLMCKNTISIGWDGRLYDCDFNQMLDLPVEDNMTVESFNVERLRRRRIMVNQHCFGCTAGSGSSCGGALVS